MAVPVVVTGSVMTNANANGATGAGALPTGTVAGNLLGAEVCIRGTTTVNSVPSGWTEKENRVSTTGTIMRVYFYTYTATGSDPASWTWGFTGTTVNTIVTYRVTGADTSNPVDVTNGMGAAANAITYTLPGFTTTGPDKLLLYAGAPSGAVTHTSVTGMTEFYDSSAGSGTSQRAVAGYWQDFLTAGVLADKTVTLSGSSPYSGAILATNPTAAVAAADPDVYLITQPVIFY